MLHIKFRNRKKKEGRKKTYKKNNNKGFKNSVLKKAQSHKLPVNHITHNVSKNKSITEIKKGLTHNTKYTNINFQNSFSRLKKQISFSRLTTNVVSLENDI